MKKILVSLLCVVMMVTFMPSMAFATEDILNDNLSTEVKPCVQIGSQQYSSLEEAINAAKSGDTVKLLDNVVISPDPELKDTGLIPQIVISGKNIILDLNGKKISNNMLIAEKEFSYTPTIFSVENNSKVVITGNGIIDAEFGNNNSYGVQINGGNVTIENGSFYGAITAFQVQQGELVIKDGYFDLAETCKPLVPSYAKYIVNCIDESFKNKTAMIKISGGKFAGFDPSNNPEGENTTYLLPGYTAQNSNGTYSIIQNKDNIIKVKDKDGSLKGAYASVAEAVNAASDNDRIEILKDITVTDPISPKKKLTFVGAKADGTKAKISGSKGMFSQSGNSEFTLKNLNLEATEQNQWYIYHSAKKLTVENCEFTMASGVTSVRNLIMGEGNSVADPTYSLSFKNNNVTANSRAAIVGIGNNSDITGNMIDLVNEKHGDTDSRTSILALTAVKDSGKVVIENNTFKNANRGMAVDNSNLSAVDLTFKDNKFVNVRFAFELSPEKNNDCGIYDLNKNYYNFDGKVSELKVQNADASGNKFAFGEGSVEYRPAEGTSQVDNSVYYIADTMRPEDLNNYVPPYIPPVNPPASDNVTNDTDDKTTNADIDATINADGKAEATVDQTTADKIVDKAVANGSTEITIDATTSVGKADAAEVKLPAETVAQLVEKTDADIIVKTDAAEVKLDQEAAKAITETASTGTVSIIVEKTKDESAEMRFELKVVTENGAVSDFKGGAAAVTVKLNDSLKDKELVCVYIDENGRYYKVKGEKDVLKGVFTFFTDHFSTYAIMEAEAADQIIEEQTNARLKAGVENTTIKMYYKKGEIGKGWIKLRFKKSFGYKVDNYEIFRSAKKKTGFGDEAWFVTKTNKTKGFYKNGKSVKKGTRYYYKMRGVREIAGETVYTQWSNIVMRTGR